MARLIDADKLIEHLGKYKFGAISNEHEREYTREVMMCFVNGMSTAYDVEKVVEQTHQIFRDELNIILEDIPEGASYTKEAHRLLSLNKKINNAIRNGGKE
jgi:hypothetical protein